MAGWQAGQGDFGMTYPSPACGGGCRRRRRVGAEFRIHPTRLLAALGATLPFQGRDKPTHSPNNFAALLYATSVRSLSSSGTLSRNSQPGQSNG